MFCPLGCFVLVTFCPVGRFFHGTILGTLCPWDVLSPGTLDVLYPRRLDVLSPGALDVLSLGRFVPWDVFSIGPSVWEPYVPGTFCLLGRFVPLDVLYCGMFCHVGRFVHGTSCLGTLLWRYSSYSTPENRPPLRLHGVQLGGSTDREGESLASGASQVYLSPTIVPSLPL